MTEPRLKLRLWNCYTNICQQFYLQTLSVFRFVVLCGFKTTTNWERNSWIGKILCKILSWKRAIGGSRGDVPGARPPKGPDSFVLTYKIFETYQPRESTPPTRSTPPYGKSWIRHWEPHIFWGNWALMTVEIGIWLRNILLRTFLLGIAKDFTAKSWADVGRWVVGLIHTCFRWLNAKASMRPAHVYSPMVVRILTIKY